MEIKNDVEALCKLLTTIGHKLDHPKALSYMSQYLDRMRTMTEKGDSPLQSRLTFMIKDVLDLRRNRWRVKESQKQERPKTLILTKCTGIMLKRRSIKEAAAAKGMHR